MKALITLLLLLLSALPACAMDAPADVLKWAATFAESVARPADPMWPSAATDGPPLSFVLGGLPSAALLRTWRRSTRRSEAARRTTFRYQWTDPSTGLRVEATVVAFKELPAVEWVVRFENRGVRDTPILEDVQVLDGRFSASDRPLVLDQIEGDHTNERSFIPIERELKPDEQLSLMPSDGRPSSGTFPFFNLQSGDRGFFTAIGWTGRWAAHLTRGAAGATRLRAGLEHTHLVLHPGESIRTPRVLLMGWSGDRIEAHNAFRRLLLTNYLPRLRGKPIVPALGAQTFNSWSGGTVGPEWGTEEGQLAALAVNKAIGADTLWMDAGWFEGGFPNGAGNWVPRAKDFPRGLGPVGERCRAEGLRFLVWYEPERVAPGSRIAREHPEFVLGGAAGGLFDLSDPAARRWMTDLLSAQISEFGINCWRSDFNMDPLPYWRRNDAPDRQGMTEIRYVEGLYAMWDELRARHPGIYIDMCASGGRRIDLETVMRSIVQTRSDTEGGAGRADWDQSQAYGLNLFLPIHCAFEWETPAYDIRSTATAGFLGEWDLLTSAFPVAEVKKSFAEVRANRPYWYGDYYPLTPWSLAPDAWMAWQLHRSDLDSGIVLAFRHAQNATPKLDVLLHAVSPDRRYEVTFIDEDHRSAKRTMSGAELAVLHLRIGRPRASLIVRYRPAP